MGIISSDDDGGNGGIATTVIIVVVVVVLIVVGVGLLLYDRFVVRRFDDESSKNSDVTIARKEDKEARIDANVARIHRSVVTNHYKNQKISGKVKRNNRRLDDDDDHSIAPHATTDKSSSRRRRRDVEDNEIGGGGGGGVDDEIPKKSSSVIDDDADAGDDDGDDDDDDDLITDCPGIDNGDARDGLALPKLREPPLAILGGYRTLFDPESGEFRYPKSTTGIHAEWWTSERDCHAMYTALYDVVRYAGTVENNETSTIGEYVRSISVLRDFAQRFIDATDGVAWFRERRLDDWRLLYCEAMRHFALCMRFVPDARLRSLSRRCVDALMIGPCSLRDEMLDDALDETTAYRLAFAWFVAAISENNAQLATDLRAGRGPSAEAVGGATALRRYNALLRTMRDPAAAATAALASSASSMFPALSSRYDAASIPAPHTVVLLRDRGRLASEYRRPFYGDVWRKWVRGAPLRALDLRAETIAATDDRDVLEIFVHAQVKYTAFGLFGDGYDVPGHYMWPETRLGLGVVPSIGYMRMYAQRYAFAMRLFKRDQPFHSYRASRFDARFMFACAMHRMFRQIDSRSPASESGYLPGSIVPDDLSEHWVLENSRSEYDASDRRVLLYPWKAKGAVAVSRSVGVATQTYEMFRGLEVVEHVLLDYRNGRVYVYCEMRNSTDRSFSYHTSARSDDAVQRVPAGANTVVFSHADFDDPALKSILLCGPIGFNEFIARTDCVLRYRSYMEDGYVYHHVDMEDGTRDISVVSRDDMTGVPSRRLVIRGVVYELDPEYNQYVSSRERLDESKISSTTRRKMTSSSSIGRRNKLRRFGDPITADGSSDGGGGGGGPKNSKNFEKSKLQQRPIVVKT